MRISWKEPTSFTSFVYLDMLCHYAVAVCSATEKQNGVNSSDKNYGKQHKNPVKYGGQRLNKSGTIPQ